MKNAALIKLPDWVGSFLKDWPEQCETHESRMSLAIALAKESVQRKSGGPFGAAVFEKESGKLVSVGVNLVVPSELSIAHAEVVALALAQQRVSRYTLAAQGLPEHQLVSSAQMCAMCFGATLWSGVRSVIFGALASDVEAITGFDEGPIPEKWQEELSKRGIEYEAGVLREEACQVLRDYVEAGGEVYNP